MTIERAVLDTNVLISAVLSGAGTPARLLDALRGESAVLVFSPETFEELKSRLLRSKFDRYVSVSLRHRFLAEMDAVAEFTSIAGAAMGCGDPDDDKFLETALLGEADVLVTGDSDLLQMPPPGALSICTPADALLRIFG